MSNGKDISITINNQTHHFRSGDVEAIRKLPWSERKVLIELLEDIKQAEYVGSKKSAEPAQDAVFDANSNQQHAVVNSAANQILTTAKQTSAKLDPEIKASEQDVDDLMARLILEQNGQNKHSSVPDKSSAIKLLLVVFAVIIVLILMS